MIYIKPQAENGNSSSINDDDISDAKKEQETLALKFLGKLQKLNLIIQLKQDPLPFTPQLQSSYSRLGESSVPLPSPALAQKHSALMEDGLSRKQYKLNEEFRQNVIGILTAK